MFKIFHAISRSPLMMLIGLIAMVFLYPHISYSYHGQEISILLVSAEFISKCARESSQRIAGYRVNDSSFVNQNINSVMKVYLPNGTLIETSSSVEGFIVNQTGVQCHAILIVNNYVTKCNSCYTVYQL